ncbi:MAG: hypothetical protein K0S54_2682 [Alphaproteobacteria bacterium]|nr:hypothetical protein [Alphaproteobacteria bacterium]
MSDMAMRAQGLRRMLRAQSVAVIGASADASRVGGRPIALMQGYGFNGAIHPVNLKADTIQGLPAWRSVADIPAEVDLAICSVPAEQVAETVRQCAARGIPGVIVFAGGFAEVDEAGRARQEELAQIARTSSIRILGPNSVGFADFRRGLVASFHPAFPPSMPRDGRIGLVTQSGAFAGMSSLLAAARGGSFSYVLATGNEADVEVAECVAFLAEDENTDVILCYIETCRDGPRMIEALALAQKRRKPVVVVKLGRTEAGARAAQSHSAALAGADAIYDAVFRQFGVYRARSLEEFFDVGFAAAIAPLPKGDSLGIMTVSGGAGVLLADTAVDYGLSVDPLPEACRQEMRELVPIAGVENPLDLTGYVINSPPLFSRAMRMIVEGTDFASISAYQGGLYRNRQAIEPHLPIWRAVRQDHPNRLFTLSGFMDGDCHRAFEALGIPTYREPTHAIRATAALRHFARAFAREKTVRRKTATPPLPTGPIDEPEALGFLQEAGIPAAPHRLAGSPDEAVAAAEAFGFPVALKIVASGLIHKSDIGGVRLNLANAEAVRAGFDSIVTVVRQARPDLAIRGCLVMPMQRGGVECIIGTVRDPSFGPAVMFGLGGVLVEVLKDVSFRIAPFDVAEAHRMIDETRGAVILNGVRGAPPADREALALALARLSEIAHAHAASVRSIEANPFMVFPRGQGAAAVDAVIERDS